LHALHGKLKGAENEVKSSIKLGATLEDDEVLLNGYYTLTSIYEMQGNATDAVKSLEGLKSKLEKMGVLGDPTFLKEQFSNSDLTVSLALINAKINNFNRQIENEQVAKNNQRLYNGLWISALLVVLIGSILLYIRQKNKLLQEKLNTVLKAQEVEFMKVRIEGEEIGRQRIARQIHDGVGGLLVSAKWNLESALEEISNKETKVAARLNENLRLQENSYKELRRVVYELEREDTPWWEDLQKFYQELDNPNKTKIQFYTYNLDKRIGGSIGEEARLMVQEIVTNALKHAKASEITVQINQINDELGIIIEDNGIGFDAERVNKGIGLQSLDERCAKLGGSISFETGKGAGTTVFVDIPLKKQSILTENPLLYGTN
jgi:two-component system sensor histidine kinase DegS